MSKKRKKNKKKSSIYKHFSLILIFLSVFLIGYIGFSGIFDVIYLLISGVILFVFDLIFILFLYRGKRLGKILFFLFIAFHVLLVFNVGKTISFLQGLNLNYKTYHFSVVVLKDSDYEKIKDIDGLTLGYYDEKSFNIKGALKKVSKKVSVENKEYHDTHQIANDLFDKKVEAILIEESVMEMLNESYGEGDAFKDKIRIIYEFNIVAKVSDFSKDININKEPFNVYVTGIDTYGEISGVSRSDVNMVVTVNPDTHQILLTSIPRDYYVKLHDRSGYNDKLTHAGLYGVDVSMHTIEDLLDIKINYYVKVNFSSVVNVVDAIGGVSVYSDYDFVSIDQFHYTKGFNVVNGEQALSFARERKAFPSGDRQRVKNQQALFSAIFDKALSKTIIVKYNKLLNSVNGTFATNMKISRLTSFVRLQILKNSSWNISVNSLEGSDSSNYTYSAPSFRAYVMEPKKESVENAHNLIESVLNGEVLESSSKKKNATDSVNVVTKKDVKVEESKPESVKKLSAELERKTVTFGEDEDFIYYGYVAHYDGKDVTKERSLKQSFQVNGKKFDDYQELVLYMSQLKKGDYVITYVIQYEGQTVQLNQDVKIMESSVEDKKSNVDNSDINSDEKLEDEDGVKDKKDENNELDSTDDISTDSEQSDSNYVSDD